MALVRTRNRPESVFDLVNSNLFQEFDRFFSQPSAVNNVSNGFMADFYETEDALVLEMAVPGYQAEQLDISIEGRDLSVKGKTATEEKTEDQDRRYWMQSISRSEFSRSLRLPQTVDVENINATVQDGILQVTMPKVAEAKVKKIAIGNA